MEELKTINEIKKDMKNYYQKLNYLYSKANTKSKRDRLLSSISILDHICSEDFFSFGDLSGDWIKDIKLEYDIENIFNMFCKNADDNMSLISKLSRNTINNFKNIKYPFYKNYHICNYLPLDRIISLVKEFYLDFGDDNIEKFIKSFNKDNLYIEPFEANYSGLLFPFDLIKKNIILINNNLPQDLYFASSLAHELGHAYESYLYYKRDLFDKGSTIFSEVVSSFFEYLFLKYIKDNNLYQKEINNELNVFYIELFNDAFSSSIISSMKNRVINDNGEICLDDEKAMDNAEKKKEELNYYRDLPNYKDKIRFRDPIIYYIGKIIAISLYHNYLQDPKEFMKNFNTVLVNYPRTKSIDSFEVVGITKDELLSGKVLKKELNKFIKDK